MLTNYQLSEIELAAIRTQQGGRIATYNATSSGTSTELRWQPYVHGNIALWNGKTWTIITPDYIPAYNTSLDTTGQALAADTNYDVYVKYQTSTSGSLELVKWAGDNSRGYSGPNRTDGGVFVYDNSATGKTMRYVGAVRVIQVLSTKYFIDGRYQRFVVNWDHLITSAVNASNSGGSTWVINTSGSSPIEVAVGNIRGEFLCLDNMCYLGGTKLGNLNTENVANWRWAGTFINTVLATSGPKHGWSQDGASSGNRGHEPGTIGTAYTRLGLNYLSIGGGNTVSMTFDPGTSPEIRTAGSLLIYT